MNPIYLDYNATTPIDPEVADAMRPFLETYFGNPSSGHQYGRVTKKAVDAAREQVAGLLGCRADEIVFTSGGSESNNFAIKGIAGAHSERGNHIITSAIEHPAVIEVCRFLERKGFEVSYLPVDSYGLVDPDELRNAITAKTILISIMHANNEVGSIQPIAEIAEIAKAHGIFFHTDAAQSIGKIAVNVDELGADLLTVVGHKIYAHKGIGALYIRRGTELQRLIHGASHESGWRSGTENVLQMAGLGTACEIAGRDLFKNQQTMVRTRDLLFRLLQETSVGVRLNGHPEKRLPNTLNVGFQNIKANELLAEMTGVAASAGAACHSDKIAVSDVIAAMQVPEAYAMGTIRFSTGKTTTEDEVRASAEIIQNALNTLSGS